MTGMKEGAGEDPFADDSEDTVTETPDQLEESTQSSASRTQDVASESESSSDRGRESMQIPYKFRRDGVQDGRTRVPLFLQPETKTDERDALREMEERFGDDVSLTDLREALMKVGLENLTEVETHLEEWGYGLTFDD